jgi:hypothetical protein
LSYPCSHTVPYLRGKKYPRDLYPELYEYRPVQERLEKKVLRSLKRIPSLDKEITRQCYMQDAATFIPNKEVNCIITSPAYMRRLDYARDNRLRLWFLGVQDWKSLDSIISPQEKSFLEILRSCLKLWASILNHHGFCILILGDTFSRVHKSTLPDIISDIATKELGNFSVFEKYTENIPNERRVRRNCSGNIKETILVLRNNKV